jgi:hypothetical protein
MLAGFLLCAGQARAVKISSQPAQACLPTTHICRVIFLAVAAIKCVFHTLQSRPHCVVVQGHKGNKILGYRGHLQGYPYLLSCGHGKQRYNTLARYDGG